MMSKALLLVDIQNEYFPGGKLPLEGSVEASLKAQEALTHFRNEKLPIIHIQHITTRPGVPIFIAGTPEIEIHENVKPLPGELIVQKNFPNSFRDTPLLDNVKDLGIRQLVICGNMTHMCIDATTRAAFDHGFDCVVLSDACATMSLTNDNLVVPANHVQASFLAALGWVYAKIVKVDDFLEEIGQR